MNNFQTDYPIGYWFTDNYIEKTIKDIRKDKDGFNEYLLNDDRWVSGKWITFCCD